MKGIVENIKTERLSRGWTLQDVSDRTGISITVLGALESGNSGNLVAPSVADALLRKYSAALKAEAEQTAYCAQKTAAKDGAGFGKTFQFIMTGLILCAALVVVFLGTVFWSAQDTKDLSLTSYEPATGQSVTTPSTTTSEQKKVSVPKELPLERRDLPAVAKQAPGPSPADVTPGSVPVREEDAIAAVEPAEKAVDSNHPRAYARLVHSLEIVTDQRTWIQVVVDGKNTETELLQAGETRKWRAMDKVDLVVGNGGGVRVEWDGNPVEISSGRGHVVRLTLPKS
jgi:cytoskeleton protein RodZ